MADLQTLFERGSDEFVAVVGALSGDSWSTPTPCDISVRELIEHVLAGNEFAVRLLAGASAAAATAGIDEIRLGPDPVHRSPRGHRRHPWTASDPGEARPVATAHRVRLLDAFGRRTP